jgi:hypothetical protein
MPYDEALDPYELIDELVRDPANPPSLVALDGYLGRSDDEAYIRFYRDLSLSYWLEIPKDAVRLSKTVDVAGKFYRLTVVWIDRDAPVRARLLNPEDPVIRDFLEGSDFPAGRLHEVDLPDDYTSETGLWCNNLQGTVRHDRRPGHWTRCR